MAGLVLEADDRLLTGPSDNEDSAVVRFPAGKALVQTVDFFTPIVNDPYRFGQIAAANAFSDVYAMGGAPYAAMNIVCFPIKKISKDVLRGILQGGIDKIHEAGAVLAGGHSVEDDEIKYGLAVSGTIDPKRFATNRGLRPGDRLLLTKPIGTGVLATAVKAGLGDTDALEDILYKWAGKLSKAGGGVIETLSLKAATDVTGFGLGGHILEMAKASGLAVELKLDKVPFIKEAVEFAGLGMIPAGSFANKKFCSSLVEVSGHADPILLDLVFDAQTSGGLVLAVPEDKQVLAEAMLLEAGDLAAAIGQVAPFAQDRGRLRIIA